MSRRVRYMLMLQAVVLLFSGYVWGSLVQRLIDGILWGTAQTNDEIDNWKLLLFSGGFVVVLVVFLIARKVFQKMLDAQVRSAVD
jgi:hypothetical protein